MAKRESFLEKVRRAVADYMCSEGCGCCRGGKHALNKEVLAKLLKVPPYEDNSGYDFGKFETKE